MKRSGNNAIPDTVTDPHIHELSRKVARERGCVAAVVLRGLAYKVQTSKTPWRGMKWFYDPIDTLSAVRWPYIPPATLHDNLKKLTADGLVITDKNNKKSYDRTTWYSMPQEAINAAAEDLIWFDVPTARAIDIEAALIFHNLRYHIRERLKDDPDAIPYHHLSPSQLSDALPMSRSTAKRKIKALAKSGRIQRHATKSGYWTIPNAQNSEGSVPDKTGSKPDETGSESDMRGSEPDNNTHYETIKKPFGNPFKRPQPPAAVSGEINPSPETIQNEPNPTPIPADAEGECGYSVEGLKNDITLYAEMYELVNDDETKRANMLELIRRIVDGILQTLSLEDIQEFKSKDNEQITKSLFARIKAFFQKHSDKMQKFDATLVDLVQNLTIQAFIAAFINSKRRAYSPFPVILLPIRDLGDISYGIELTVGKCLHEENERKYQEWIQRRKKVLASKDVDKEHNADRAPADKMRVFRNALQSRNDIGGDYWDGTYWRKPFMTIYNPALLKVVKLFELNPDCSPADLLVVMDGCINLFMTQQPPPKIEHDPLWHARRGIDLDFFVKYLPVICQELAIHCPIERNLG